jgi:hypothetical protein
MTISYKLLLMLLFLLCHVSIQGQQLRQRGDRQLKRRTRKRMGKKAKVGGGGGGGGRGSGDDRAGNYGPFPLIEKRQCLAADHPSVVAAKKHTTPFNPCYTLTGCTGGCCRVNEKPEVLLCDTRNLFPDKSCVCGSQVPGVGGGFVVPLP